MSVSCVTFRVVGYLSLVCAALGIVASAIPGFGKYVAIGLGIFAIGTGVVGYRRAGSRAPGRLAGAAAVALGILAIVLGGAKVGLTWIVLHRLASLFH